MNPARPGTCRGHSGHPCQGSGDERRRHHGPRGTRIKVGLEQRGCRCLRTRRSRVPPSLAEAMPPAATLPTGNKHLAGIVPGGFSRKTGGARAPSSPNAVQQAPAWCIKPPPAPPPSFAPHFTPPPLPPPSRRPKARPTQASAHQPAVHRAGLRMLHAALRMLHAALRLLHAALRLLHAALRLLHAALRMLHAALRMLHAALRMLHAALRMGPVRIFVFEASPSPAKEGACQGSSRGRHREQWPVDHAWRVSGYAAPPRPTSAGNNPRRQGLHGQGAAVNEGWRVSRCSALRAHVVPPPLPSSGLLSVDCPGSGGAATFSTPA